MRTDTIAAIASGLTHSGIGIIRISGEKAFFVADRLLQLSGGKSLAEIPTHTINYGFVREKEERIDQVLVMAMRAPRSYTGEDVIEIQCHGGPLIMKKILSLAIAQGARLADPGEFTKRAFLHGKMDLSQAEAVMELIHSQNEFARKTSLEQLQGSLGTKIKAMREEILYHLAFLEAALDDPEHIRLEGYREELNRRLIPLREELEKMISGADEGRMLAEGIRTVILGRPNAGKSSLLNLLLGEERAIVTEIAGTTRDTLEETMRLGDFSLRLVDTAGIRETQDIVEKIGVEKAREQAKKAELILYVIDSTQPVLHEEEKLLKEFKEKRILVLYNKSDLSCGENIEEIQKIIPYPVISFSAREGKGMEELLESIQNMFGQGKIGRGDSVTIINLRHREAMEKALESLLLVQGSIDYGMPEDFFSIDLMDAYQRLGWILGESVGDDLVNEIFGKFCMGK